MAQYGRPISDVSKANLNYSSGTTVYTLLDETPYNDSDWVQSQDSKTGTFEVALTNTIGDPRSSSGHYVRYRLYYQNNLTSTYTVTLKQGTTTIASWSGTVSPDETWVGFEQTLTGAQADAITDYTALRIYVSIKSVSTANAYCSWVEFECPDAPPPAGLEMGMMF